MKCLSIRQPWAWLVCVGAKTVENRTWNATHRGCIAIHAGGFAKAVDQLLKQDVDQSVKREFFTFGAIIGVAELYDSEPFEGSFRDDPWAEGPYCLWFRNPHLFLHPIPHKGRVNLCELPNDVTKLVQDRMKECAKLESNEEVQKCIQSIPSGPISQDLLRPSFKSSRM